MLGGVLAQVCPVVRMMILISIHNRDRIKRFILLTVLVDYFEYIFFLRITFSQMNVFKRISSFTGAKLVKNSKRFLFAYHFFAINYENVCDSRLSLTFFQRAQLPSYFLLPFSPIIHKKDRKQISTSPIYNKV